MSSNFYLNWAALAVSLFNVILLAWLGMVVMLSAEQRGLGVWVAGGELLAGAAFFVSHTVILANAPSLYDEGINFWWRLGWIPVVGLPYAWYGVMLWYTGYWSRPASPLRSRQRAWLWTAGLLALLVIGLLAFANPLPSLAGLAELQFQAALSVGGVPLLALLYPAYIFICTGASVDALRRPEPSARIMGDLARRRARPWLAAGSMVQMAVSLLVGWAILWIVLAAPEARSDARMAEAVMIFDVVIASLITAAALLVGQAIVSYEVFTGQTLPRGGLRGHWRRLIALAAAAALATGFGLTLPLPAVYLILLGVLAAAVLYALLSFAAIAEQEKSMARLRPFVASQRLYDQLTGRDDSPVQEIDAYPPFRALCEAILGAKLVYLVPLGALAPLVRQTLAYPRRPAGEPLPEAVAQALAAQLPSLSAPDRLVLAIEPSASGGVAWVAPLWSGQALIGALLIGEKRDGRLYTQEEMEIARAAGERLVDAQASAEIARRLMALQRQRLAEAQIIDQRTRRTLHDEVLPRLHAAMLELSSGGSPQALNALAGVHRQIADLLHDLPSAASPEVRQSGLLGALRAAAAEMHTAFDHIAWEIDPAAERKCSEIPPLYAEVIYFAAREAMRNAARHARGAAPLRLRIAARWEEGLELVVEDNGVGLGEAAPAAESSGQGLTLHSTMMAVIGGSLALESRPGEWTRAVIKWAGTNDPP